MAMDKYCDDNVREVGGYSKVEMSGFEAEEAEQVINSIVDK